MLLQRYNIFIRICCHNGRITACNQYSTAASAKRDNLVLSGQEFLRDDWTNVTPKIIEKIGRNLHVTKYHPLSHVRERIVNYFYQLYRNPTGNPMFSIFTNINPIVTTQQNFDTLLVPAEHPSRSKSDCYYINRDTMLRAHTTAHQAELISMGLNNFLIIGDVYRRDEIDAKHYPVFHQVDAVRLCAAEEVFKNVNSSDCLKIFEENGKETTEKQDCHTLEATKLMENELKSTLIGLAKVLFGQDVKCRWTDAYFPFTHPSWELEVFFNDDWFELLGCGIMRQKIVERAGATDRIGWAFGLGLERIAMCLYNIPDIRLFWSKDTGFLNQFVSDDPNIPIRYKPVSIYPPCKNDISFWLPEDGNYTPNDFYDLVREIGGDVIQEITLKDEYVNPKTNRLSHCYTIVYRHMERTLNKGEVNFIHSKIAKAVNEKLNGTVR